MFVLEADALHLPLLLPERGHVATTAKWRYCPEDTPLSSGLFFARMSNGAANASDIACGLIVRLGALDCIFIVVQAEQFQNLVVRFFNADAFECGEKLRSKRE